MSCLHMRIEGKTTKYFFCAALEKPINDYDCYTCPLKLEERKNEDIADKFMGGIFKDIFGGGN